jgi:2'-5' RNA ligase
MKQRRIFLAINIPGETRNALDFFAQPFCKNNRVRVLDREGWHVTLVFIGDADETETGSVKAVIDDIVGSFSCFTLTPFKLCFAPETDPRMIWLGFRPCPEFVKLKEETEKRILAGRKNGIFSRFRKDERGGVPHLTLARFRPENFSTLKNLLPGGGVDVSADIDPFEVSSFELMESRLDFTGAEYEILHRAEFKK